MLPYSFTVTPSLFNAYKDAAERDVIHKFYL